MGGAMGTPRYMAPEQWEDARRVTAAADIYSFGVMLYRMFCGGWPYEVDFRRGIAGWMVAHFRAEPIPPQRLRADLPDRLAELMLKCLRKEPQQRPRSFEEIEETLRNIYRRLTGREYSGGADARVELRAAGLNNAAVSFWMLGERTAAQRLWERALELSPSHPQSIYNSGLAAWREGREDDAALLKRLAAVETTDPQAAYLCGLLHLDRGEAREAEGRFRTAAEAGVPGALKALGHSLMMQERFAEAVSCYERCAAAGRLEAMARARTQRSNDGANIFPARKYFLRGFPPDQTPVGIFSDGRSLYLATEALYEINPRTGAFSTVFEETYRMTGELLAAIMWGIVLFVCVVLFVVVISREPRALGLLVHAAVWVFALRQVIVSLRKRTPQKASPWRVCASGTVGALAHEKGHIVCFPSRRLVKPKTTFSVSALAVSPDGATLGLGTTDGRVVLLPLSGGDHKVIHCLQTEKGHVDYIEQILSQPEKDHMDYIERFLSLASSDTERIVSLAFLDEDTVIAGGANGHAVIVRRQGTVREFFSGSEGSAVVAAGDGWFAAGCGTRLLVAREEERRMFTLPGSVASLCFANSRLVCLCKNGLLSILDPERAETAKTFKLFDGEVLGCCSVGSDAVAAMGKSKGEWRICVMEIGDWREIEARMVFSVPQSVEALAHRQRLLEEAMQKVGTAANTQAATDGAVETLQKIAEDEPDMEALLALSRAAAKAMKTRVKGFIVARPNACRSNDQVRAFCFLPTSASYVAVDKNGSLFAYDLASGNEQAVGPRLAKDVAHIVATPSTEEENIIVAEQNAVKVYRYPNLTCVCEHTSPTFPVRDWRDSDIWRFIFALCAIYGTFITVGTIGSLILSATGLSPEISADGVALLYGGFFALLSFVLRFGRKMWRSHARIIPLCLPFWQERVFFAALLQHRHMLCVLNTRSGSARYLRVRGLRSPRCAALIPSTTTLCVGTEDGALLFVDIQKYKKVRSIRCSRFPIVCVAESAVGVVWVSEQGEVGLLDATTYRRRKLSVPRWRRVPSAALIPNTSTLLTACADGTIHAYNLRTQTETASLRLAGKGVAALGVSSDSQWLLVANEAGSATLYFIQWELSDTAAGSA